MLNLTLWKRHRVFVVPLLSLFYVGLLQPQNFLRKKLKKLRICLLKHIWVNVAIFKSFLKLVLCKILFVSDFLYFSLFYEPRLIKFNLQGLAIDSFSIKMSHSCLGLEGVLKSYKSASVLNYYRGNITKLTKYLLKVFLCERLRVIFYV